MILEFNYTTLFSDEMYSVKDFEVFKNNGIEIIYSNDLFFKKKCVPEMEINLLILKYLLNT